MRYYKTILAITAYLTFSCNTQTKVKYDKKAIELNKRATELMINNPDSALELLNESIEIDDSYYVAHNNRVNIYISQGKIDEAIYSAKKGVIAKPDLAEAVMMLGMLYDYKGQTEKAKEQYQIAINLYNNRLKISDKDKQANQLNRAHALLLFGNKTEGQKEIQQLLKENPNDFTIQILLNFDKEKYLNDLFRQEK